MAIWQISLVSFAAITLCLPLNECFVNFQADPRLYNEEKNLFALRFASNLGKRHRKYMKCSEHLSVTLPWEEHGSLVVSSIQTWRKRLKIVSVEIVPPQLVEMKNCRVRKIVKEERRSTISEITGRFCLAYGTCQGILREALYVGWSFNSGTDFFFFFLSKWVDLPASWSCLLQNSVLVLVCTYSSAPATDESTSGSHFL